MSFADITNAARAEVGLATTAAKADTGRTALQVAMDERGGLVSIHTPGVFPDADDLASPLNQENKAPAQQVLFTEPETPVETPAWLAEVMAEVKNPPPYEPEPVLTPYERDLAELQAAVKSKPFPRADPGVDPSADDMPARKPRKKRQTKAEKAASQPELPWVTQANADFEEMWADVGDLLDEPDDVSDAGIDGSQDVGYVLGYEPKPVELSIKPRFAGLNPSFGSTVNFGTRHLQSPGTITLPDGRLAVVVDLSAKAPKKGFALRIDAGLHALVTQRAADAGVSMNEWLSSRILKAVQDS